MLVTDGDDLFVKKFVAVLEGRPGGGGGHFLFEVESDVAELVLDVIDKLTLGFHTKAVTYLCQDLREPVGEVTAGEVEMDDGVRQDVTTCEIPSPESRTMPVVRPEA